MSHVGEWIDPTIPLGVPFNRAEITIRRRRGYVERYVERQIARMDPDYRVKRARAWAQSDVGSMNVWIWIHRGDLWDAFWDEDRFDFAEDLRGRLRRQRDRQARAMQYAVDCELARRAGRRDAEEDHAKWSK